jgi:hypothetical protein
MTKAEFISGGNPILLELQAKHDKATAIYDAAIKTFNVELKVRKAATVKVRDKVKGAEMARIAARMELEEGKEAREIHLARTL